MLKWVLETLIMKVRELDVTDSEQGSFAVFTGGDNEP
jgi:hypothetical protein